MKTYKIPLTLKSPLGTPLAADTLFGHICWAMVYHEGQVALEEFLDRMKSSQPPLIISDPFPVGYLPQPILSDISLQRREELLQLITSMTWQELGAKNIMPTEDVAQYAGKNPELLQAYDVLKYITRREWLPGNILEKTAGILDAGQIIKAILEHGMPGMGQAKTQLMPHNVINRLSNASDNLFFTDDVFADQQGSRYELYAATIFAADRVYTLLKWALEGGYGRDKSIGRGIIDVAQPVEIELPRADNPNAAMLLGPCMPARTDPTRGYWQIHAKAPKLGGPWAIGLGPDGEHHNPFKYPLVMLRAGSVFITDNPRVWYGRMTEHVHPHFDEIVQYGLALALPLRMANLDESEVA